MVRALRHILLNFQEKFLSMYIHISQWEISQREFVCKNRNFLAIQFLCFLFVNFENLLLHLKRVFRISFWTTFFNRFSCNRRGPEYHGVVLSAVPDRFRYTVTEKFMTISQLNFFYDKIQHFVDYTFLEMVVWLRFL